MISALPMSVLVADHEPVWQEFVRTRLQASGVQASLVVNGDRTWEVLQEKDAPRLAIIDRRLPGLGALEICRRVRLRTEPFYTYILLLLPNTSRVDELVALEAGADDCLSKPFGKEEFAARIAVAQRILAVDRRLSAINSRWRTVLDNLPFGVAAIDGKGILKRMNATFAAQMGTGIQALLGQPLAQVLQRRVDLNGLLEEVRWAEPFNDVEVQCRSAKGKTRSVHLWGRPLPPNDEAVYEIVVQDSTEALKSS